MPKNPTTRTITLSILTLVHVLPLKFPQLLTGIPLADKDNIDVYLKRAPGLGLKVEQLDRFAEAAKDDARTEKELFDGMREMALRNFSDLDNVSSLDELLQVLRKEIESGKAPKLPAWFVPSSVSFGPRRLGYRGCDNRGCFRVETPEEEFKRCGGCVRVRVRVRACERLPRAMPSV